MNTRNLTMQLIQYPYKNHEVLMHIKQEDLNHYDALQISREASAVEIKQSYQRLLRIAHPEKGGTTEEFMRIRQAYKVLSHANSRKIYDSFGELSGNMKNFSNNFKAGMRELSNIFKEVAQIKKAVHASRLNRMSLGAGFSLGFLLSSAATACLFNHSSLATGLALCGLAFNVYVLYEATGMIDESRERQSNLESVFGFAKALHKEVADERRAMGMIEKHIEENTLRLTYY